MVDIRASRLMLAVTAAGAVIGVLSVGLLGPRAPRVPTALESPAGEHDAPPALARHLARLQQTIPGLGGESGDGRASYEDEQYQNLAYPDTEVPIDRFETARQAFDAVRGRGVGLGRSGNWISLGPTSAQYQETKYRFSYVPSQYEASGRVTAMAIASACQSGNCRMWVAAAGGGIWRTNDALAGSPQWRFLTATLGLSAVGSIQLDPNGPSGNTMWVGTGEANASADSAAGVGLYRSTDGGNTWTGPLGQSIFAGRSIGSIRRAGQRRVVRRVGARRARRHVGQRRRHHQPAGGAALRPVEVDRRRRDVHLHPQRHGQRRRLLPDDHGGLLGARGAARRARPVRPEHGLCRLVRPRHVAIERRRRHLDADQGVAGRQQLQHAARDRGRRPAQR